MKPSRQFFRQTFVVGFSIYYSLFSTGALAATAEKSKQVQKPTAKKAAVIDKASIPLASPAEVKLYQENLRWALPEVDLFPASITSASGPVSNLPVPVLTPNVAILDPLQQPPLPPDPNGTTFPSGNSLPPSFPGGGTIPQNQNVMTTAPVPAEFACPFFDNNPYESLFRALDSMKQSITSINNDCLPKRDSDLITSNGDRIKDAITYLKYFQANPGQIPAANTRDLDNAITGVVSAVNHISTNLANTSITSRECGAYTSSLNRTILAFNEVINNLAPIALVAAAFNPAVTATAQGAIFGTTVVSKTFSSFWDTFMNNSVDMTNPDHRKAVLQNTCQYLKIAQKVNFLNYKTEDKIQDLTASHNYKVKQYQSQYKAASDNLVPLLKYRYNNEKMLAEVETSLAVDRLNFRSFAIAIKNMKNDPERVCGYAAGRAKTARIVDNFSSLSTFGGGFGGYSMPNTLTAFPLSIVANLDRVTEALQQSSGNLYPLNFGSFNNTLPTPAPTNPIPSPLLPTDANSTPLPGDPNSQQVPGPVVGNDIFNPLPPAPVPSTQDDVNAQAEQLFQAFKKSRNRIVSLSEDVQNGSVIAIKGCFEETMLWIDRMSALMEFTANLANGERSGILKELESNEEYRAWAVEYEKLRSERRTLSPILKVLKAMSASDAESVRSELNQRLNTLRLSLFKRPYSVSESPVEGWLNNNLKMHENTLGEYVTAVEDLQMGAFEVTQEKRNAVLKVLQRHTDRVSTSSLSTLTLENIKIGTRTHERACQQINTALLKLNAANDYLNSAEFMCDMIDGIMSDTSSQIIQICRGSRTFNESKNANSEINQRRTNLKTRKIIYGGYTPDEFNKILEARAKTLQCPPASSPLIL